MLFVVCMTIQKVVKSFSIKEQKALKTATNPHSRELNRPFSLVDFTDHLTIPRGVFPFKVRHFNDKGARGQSF